MGDYRDSLARGGRTSEREHDLVIHPPITRTARADRGGVPQPRADHGRDHRRDRGRPTQKRVKPAASKTAGTPKSYSDNLPGGLQKQQAKLRKQALIQRLKGVPAAQKGIVKLGKNKFVDLENEGTDKIFTILVEFGDAQYTDASWPTAFQGPPPDGSTADVTGPLHNQIPAPDRSVDNSTLWQADYNREHYEDMYFNRMREYYETQSSGRYSIEGR